MPSTARRVAWAVVALSLVLYGVLEILAFMTPMAVVPSALRTQAGLGQHLFNWAFLPFSIVGALLVSRRPHNPIGWLLCAIGLMTLTQGFAQNYAFYTLYANPAVLPAGGFAAWIATWMWLAGSAVVVAPLPLMFPDGTLPSSRWRAVVWVTAGTVGLGIAIGSLSRGALADYGLTNPVGIFPSSAHSISMFLLLGALLLAPLVSTIAVVRRFRRAAAEQRQQIKWFVTAVALQAALLIFESLLVATTGIEPYRFPAFNFLSAAALAMLPVSIGIAVLKYRLYDIDVVLNKSAVFGTMAAFITAVYVGVVVGLGWVLGSGSRPSLPLSILATGIVAVAFQPVRDRVQRLANRLVYGKRATPYEVLSQFSERVGGVYNSEEVLPRMARVLGEATSALRADVWIRLGDEIAPAASWPANDGRTRSRLAITGQALPMVPEVSRIVPVRHQRELLGALSINKRPGEALTPVEEKLLADLAAQAGLVMRNVRLTVELQERLRESSARSAELRAARQRLVAAGSVARSQLERNIQAATEPRLLSIAGRIAGARQLVQRDGDRAAAVLGELTDEANETLELLRDLARGIYPPLLIDKGPVAALQAYLKKAAIPVELDTDREFATHRFAEQVEGAVYFCCVEALQNVVQHAGAAPAVIWLSAAEGRVEFSVADSRPGIEPHHGEAGPSLQTMTDRVRALGGELGVRSIPGAGTTVIGWIPASALEPSA